MNRGKPNWEHLNEDLHVLITVEDTRNRAEVKLKRAVEEVQRLLVPAVSTYQHAVLRDKYRRRLRTIESGAVHVFCETCIVTVVRLYCQYLQYLCSSISTSITVEAFVRIELGGGDFLARGQDHALETAGV